MEIKKTDTKVSCSTHGDTVEVTITKKDDLGFIRVICCCKQCFDDALEQYMEPLCCVECGVAVPKGMGIEKGGDMTPMCNRCIGRKLTRTR